MKSTGKPKTAQTENNRQERKPVAALVRVSTDEQAAEGKFGIPAQKDAIEKIAKLNDLQIDYWFQIEGVSGSYVIDSSPKMQELLGLVRRGRISGIIVKEESRLMRKLDSNVIDLLAANNVLIYTPGAAPLDFSDADQRMVGEIKYAVARRELSMISKRMGAAKVSKMKLGLWHCGKSSVPFGLELYRDKSKGNADMLRVGAPKDINKVKNLFTAFVESGGFASFGELARQAGIPYTSIAYILRNELYTGYHVTRQMVGAPKGKKQNVLRADGTLRYQNRIEIPEDQRERIKMFEDAPISEKIFAQAQKLLALRKEMQIKVKAGAKDLYLYRGFLRCQECGRRVITLSYSYKAANNYRAEYYVCIGARGQRRVDKTVTLPSGTCKTRRMRREVLEDLIDSRIREQIADPRFLERVMAAQEDDDKPAVEEQIAQLEAQIKEVKSSLKRAQGFLVREKIDEATFDETSRELHLELAGLETALRNVRPNLTQITPAEWASIARQFVRWSKKTKDGAQLTFAEKRSILSSLGIVFEVAGYPTSHYHEIEVRVKRFSINLAAARADRDPDEEEGDESVAWKPLGVIEGQSWMDRNSNQLSMSLPL
jgi:DNA invertase Pin-like site-specific DNA recombinase